MINIVFNKKDKYLVSYNIKGHAYYGESGTDIVCSAVSALAYTFANGITDVLKVDAEINILEDGFLNLDLSKLDCENIEKCQVLMETFLLGIESLKVNYSDYIRLKVEEV